MKNQAGQILGPILSCMLLFGCAAASKESHARALIDVVFDGEVLTLMFDTGAHDTILVGATGGEDDEPILVQTADGKRCEVFLGKAVLSLPGEDPRTVPVMRAPSFPYNEDELREIQAHGLFGLTSLGWRRVVFDFEGRTLRLGPISL